MEKNETYQIFKKHLPDNAIHYCYDLWIEHRFNFRITARRKTKLGDYRYNPHKKSHSISVNGDLNNYSFLITYIHEIAHLVTFKKYGRKVDPHGKEWKINFQLLFQPLLNDLIFPQEILIPLKKYMYDPRASSYSDHVLTKALLNKNENLSLSHLDDLKKGERFIFNAKTYKKEAKRRTRILCQEIKTGKKYLISQVALVEVLNQEVS